MLLAYADNPPSLSCQWRGREVRGATGCPAGGAQARCQDDVCWGQRQGARGPGLRRAGGGWGMPRQGGVRELSCGARLRVQSWT